MRRKSYKHAALAPVISPLGLDVFYEGLNSIGPPPQVPLFAPVSVAK